MGAAPRGATRGWEKCTWVRIATHLEVFKLYSTYAKSLPSITHFSAVNDPTGSLPSEKMSSELAQSEPGYGEVLRKSSILSL
jgi:hypothetical protein